MQNLVTTSPGSVRSNHSLSRISDADLVSRYVNGEEACLGELITRHKRLIFSFIIKHAGNYELAEDIFQDTFIKVILSLKTGKYAEKNRFPTWVMSIAKNRMIDHFRISKRMKMISSLKTEGGMREDIFNRIIIKEEVNRKCIEKRQVHRKIRHLIRRLPIKQRQVLILREYFDMSYDEISKMLKININTSLGRMRYALLRLKEMAKKEKMNLADKDYCY
jgi:RNA polymerase sigma-70 factor (ECF subfamily)